LYEFIVKIVEDKVREIRVSREEFDRLVGVVNRLGEKIDRLAEAQIRTEKRLDELAIHVNELAEAQKRTEMRLEELAEAQKRTEERLNELAEAQKRTEIRLNELAEAQKRTEMRLEELAEAQKRTEERLNELAGRVDELTLTVNRLAIGFDSLRREVGRLGETIGFGLEDVARVVLPGWLERHLNVRVEGLERKFIVVDGEEIEFNLYGVGWRDGERIIVLGEVKSRIYGRDVLKFYEKIVKAEKVIGESIVAVMFGFLIHPSAAGEAKKHNIVLVASYMR